MKYSVLLLALLAGPAGADVFKCTIDGKTVYSDSKCAKDAQPVAIEVQLPDTENAQSLKQQSHKANALVNQGLRRSRAQELRNSIQALEQDIADLENRMRGELGPLETRRDRVGLDRSRRLRLDRDIQRVTADYQSRIDAGRSRLDDLRAQLGSAPAEPVESRDSTNEDVSTNRDSTPPATSSTSMTTSQ